MHTAARALLDPARDKVESTYNIASAAIKRAGSYALMSSIEVPLHGPGWNLILDIPGRRASL